MAAVCYVYDINMARNGNSVNIKNAKRAYHHGDLRAALIAAGVEILKSGSAEQLSLREAARKVGVSATAVYRHFPDKLALLYAICEETADALTEAQTAAMAAAGGGPAGFDATGRVYVRFALENPALFRLMMTTRPSRGHFESRADHVLSAMRLLRDNVAALAPKGASEREREIAVVRAWALVHGLAMLMLDGQIEPDERLIDAICAPPSD